MPISVPGSADRQRGFTLLEMMIVLLIIGIGTAVASVSALGDSGARTLRRDAQRLAQLFTTAQNQAMAGGQDIIWRHDAGGYAFARLPRRLVLPARQAARAQSSAIETPDPDSPLRARDWLSDDPVMVAIEPDVDLVFDADWVHPPMAIRLTAGGQTVHLLRLGNGRFVVQP